MHKKIGININVIFLSSLVFFAFQFSNGLTPAEQRGKLIYTKGKRSSGESIMAKLSGATFDAKILPCSNCHGLRGEGNPEGGVDPSPLDWSSLTKSYLVEFKNGRKRKAYDIASFRRAVVDGIDPSNNELDLVMPRYSLNDEDVADLISYLKIIDGQNVTGVTDSSIHIGVLLPSRDNPSVRSDAIVKTMRAYLDRVNSGGGLYNRKFYLKEIFVDDIIRKSVDSDIDYFENLDLFALIGCDLDGLPPVVLSILEENKIPVVGAISGNPKSDDYLRNNFYYLSPGLNQEIFQLTNFALENLNSDYKNFAIILDSSFSIQREELESLLKNDDLSIINMNSKNPGQLDQLSNLKSEGIHSCLFLGNADASLTFLMNSIKMNWYPNIFLPGKFASPSWLDAPLEMNNKIYFSYPTWISERKESAMNQYKIMASSYDLDKIYINAQLNGLAATILFTEVVKLTSKEVNRESMLKTLEGLDNFKTGFISPLSFGPNKRVGSEKVFIVKADLLNKKLELVNQ